MIVLSASPQNPIPIPLPRRLGDRLVVVVVLQHVVLAGDHQRLGHRRRTVGPVTHLRIERVGPIDTQMRQRRIRALHIDVAAYRCGLSRIRRDRDLALGGPVGVDLHPGARGSVRTCSQTAGLSGCERGVELADRRERGSEAPVARGVRPVGEANRSQWMAGAGCPDGGEGAVTGGVGAGGRDGRLRHHGRRGARRARDDGRRRRDRLGLGLGRRLGRRLGCAMWRRQALGVRRARAQ